MTDVITGILLSVGTFFMLVSAIGMVRLPDLFTRMSATTKSATLGVGFIVLGVGVYFGQFGIVSRALATVAFLLLTAPVAAHLIARAAYIRGVDLWDKTIADELEGKYNTERSQLESLQQSDQQEQSETPAVSTAE
jgi:multicomponent Na+:H+ antiporter subunit G